jgi:hypothetical protein
LENDLRFIGANHFSKMADAFDPLLNDAVNFHVETVDHHRNLAPAESDNVQSLSPEYGHLRRNPVSLDFDDQIGSIPTIWLERPDSGLSVLESSLSGGIPARTVGFRSFCAGFWQFWPNSDNFPEFGYFPWNLANPDSDEYVRISAFISNFGYSSRNSIRGVGILSVNDGISLSVIFILIFICFV